VSDIRSIAVDHRACVPHGNATDHKVSPMEERLATLLAELSSVTEAVGRTRHRVAGLADPFRGTERDDVVIAIYEAERLLRNAERALERTARAVR